MIKVGDRIGYIKNYRTSAEQTKDTFKYVESKVSSVRYGKTKVSVKAKGFYTLDGEEIEANTKMIMQGKLLLIREPFITNDELAERCRKACEYWTENGATGILD